MHLDLPPEICSRGDIRELAQEIHNYARWFSQDSTKKIFKTKSQSDAPVLSPTASELLRDWMMKKPLTQTSLDEITAALEKFANDAEEMTFTLAAPPAAGLKKSLVSWCRQNVAADVLVSFEFNSTILGGMVLRYKSRVFDLSWRRQILDNRTKFSEVLANVR